MKILVLLLSFAITIYAGEPLKKFKFSYSMPGETSRDYILDSTDETHARQTFHDLMPKAQIWSVQVYQP